MSSEHRQQEQGSTVETDSMGSLVSDLLAWYDRQARDLPWRQNQDPYRVWLSEVMLQQTQVATVLPYFEKFLRTFPTVHDLAAAPVEEVLAAWSGLGYYRRARQLHRAAQQVSHQGGQFPQRASELEQLPGIGAYTAAAVASIAFGEVVPVLDGNVERVLCRVLTAEGDPKRARLRRRLLQAAGTLLSEQRPGDSNQALMELGATVCRPRAPLCAECPLRPACRAAAQGTAERFPPPRVRRATQQHLWLVLVVRRQGRLLLFRRPESSEIMPGLWELPSVELAAERASELGRKVGEALAKEATTALALGYGGRWRLGELRGQVKHSITHRALTLAIYEADLNDGKTVAEGPEALWADAETLQTLALSSMVRKVLTKC